MLNEKFQNTFRIPSARATWHDYNCGMYFVTICTQEKIHYFGEIVDGEMKLNELGNECVRQIEITSQIRPDMNIAIPIYVVMPNHIHLIVCIDAPRRDAMPCVSVTESVCATAEGVNEDAKLEIVNRDAKLEIVNRDAKLQIVNRDAKLEIVNRDAKLEIVNRDAKHRVSTGEPNNKFQPQSKNLASIIRGIKSAVTMYARMNNIPFAWQPRFHDRIIRNQNECNRIAEYIENNPMNWMSDKLNIQQ